MCSFLPRVGILAALLHLAAPAASAQTTARLDALVRELLPRVEALAGLKALRPLNVAARSREELQAFLEEEARADSLDVRHAQHAYRLLGLLPDSLDLAALLPELLGESIAGYYDPRRDTLYVLDDVPVESLRGVAVHEITHALQDQHFHLETVVSDSVDNDASLAARAAFEGHATLVMLLFEFEEDKDKPGWLTELPDLTRLPLEALMPGRPPPAFATAPRLLRESGAFPYGRGVGLAQALSKRDPTAVPFGDRLPTSTEQVIDPIGRLFEARDEPTAVAFTDTVPPPWQVEYENDLGQFELSILLMERHRLQSESVANGWDGDRYRVLHDGRQRALEWFIVWDDARAASRFVETYIQILRSRMGRSAWVEQLEIDGRAVVRVIEAEEGVDLSSLPRATPRLTGGG